MKIYLDTGKIYIASKATDFRKSLDGLCALVVEEIKENPAEGMYIFYNKKGNRVKIVGYHKNGFVMVYKRLDSGKFFVEQTESKTHINRQELNWLLLGVDWKLLSNKKGEFNTYL